MSVVKIKDTVSGPGYDIVITRGLDELADNLKKPETENRRALIVTDSNVGPLYLESVKSVLITVFKDVEDFTVPAGEENKNLDRVRDILKKLVSLKFDRKDFIIALGGGVIGDMAGFVSAVYLRGIRFVQIPTTLLSQTDSSIGGKTGVDLDEYKNMVGAFHQHSFVYINTAFLRTLPKRQFASGMAEIIKHGLIRDNAYYEWLVNNFNEINDQESDVIEKMIRISCEIKARVVEEDPTEQGLRAILNFGHTIGHAIEKYSGFTLLHGECVALGMIAASYISYCRGNIDTEEFYEIRDMFLPFYLPLTLPDDYDPKEILKLSKSDKKMDGGRIRFILLKKVGKAVIDTAVTDEEILNAIDQLIIKDY
ncbi:MAG: 3-dehydroquinate synthase [Lachnospiraceae bacterium]|nr:3-dehydroquinate synthase [Lachnospiraceae bacterium]